MTEAHEPAFLFKKQTDYNTGLTKREYFAVKAIKALLTIPNHYSWSNVAKNAVKASDNLILELNKLKQNT